MVRLGSSGVCSEISWNTYTPFTAGNITSVTSGVKVPSSSNLPVEE